LRRNDPAGATLKGAIVAVLGVVFVAKGLPWLGLAFVILGVLTVGVPLWLYRRDQEQLRRWSSRHIR
jgi:hypothetical protein